MARYLDGKALRFAPASGALAALRAEVRDHFERNALRKHADVRMVGKTLFFLACVATAWWACVVVRDLPTAARALAWVILGLSCAGLGLNVPHDANHGAYARDRRLNAVMCYLADALLGASSTMWRLRHNIMHHGRPNIAGQDDTISSGGLLRLKDDEPWRPLHRYQHLYVWPLYGVVLLKWFLLDDFLWFFRRKMATYRIEMTTADTIRFFAFKASWLTVMVGIPVALRPATDVIPGVLLAYVVFSLALVIITQLAHVNGEVAFPDPNPSSGEMDDEWFVHQLRTTADFAHDNPLVTFYAGGLNFQVVHHLFPEVCHVHHPALVPIVRRFLASRGASREQYIYFPTFRAALYAHFSFLKTMGAAVAREDARARPPEWKIRPMMNRRTFGLTMVGSLALALTRARIARADDAKTAQAIMDKVLERDAFGWQGAHATVTMTLANKAGEKQTKKFESWARRVDKRLQTIIRFRSPQEVAGMAFLLIEKDGPSEQHIYLPGLKRTRRLVGNERRGSFAGSDVTYADFERQDLKEGKHKRLPDESIGTIACYVVESAPKDEVYSKIVTWARQDNFLAQRVKFYDPSGALVKSVYTRRIQKVEGEWVIMEARVQNEQSGHSTDILVDQVEKLSNVTDSQFTPNALEHE